MPRQSIAVYAVSLGCPKNRVDTERALGSLGPVRMVEHPGRAHLVFINTCGFILPAVEESVRTVLELIARRKLLKRRPVLAVAGCMVGRYGAKALAKDLPEVDLWLDNRELANWPAMLARVLLQEQAAPGRLLSTGPSYAWLKVSDGCRHNCAFCTIPAIRGEQRSDSSVALVREARNLLDQGVRELVLVAQDLTAWGRDIGERGGLAALLERMLQLEGLGWLRLLYLYPAGITPRFLAFMEEHASEERLLPYFDIPLQHAHPEILAKMGRPFARDPRRVVDALRARLPDAALRTSLITGFPGEEERHFAALRQFVREARFDHLGVFSYRAEEGTPAADMPGQIPETVKEARRADIMRLQAEISAEKLETLAGRRMRVLVDAAHPEWPGLHMGRVWRQAPEIDGVTYVSGPGVRPGAMVDADIVETQEYDLSALT
jgi:tRNA-2-methylthio-N6-dimethylallyladenosine synthase/ribosomal protein S12 methylthiotransferase